MNFIYAEDIPFVNLRPARVNGHNGWAVSIGGFDEEDPDELLFEDVETFESFCRRLLDIAKREDLW